MVISIIIQKIISLFIILFLGMVMVRTGLLKIQASKVLSVLSIYLMMPCIIITAFQIDYTPEVRNGLLLAAGAAVAIHILLIGLTWALKRWLRLDAVEQISIVYSNSGNLIIPLVSAALGPEWVIYSSAFVSVQLILLWTHGQAVLCGGTQVQWRKIFTNINMIAIYIGVILFFTGVRFPWPVQDAVESVGNMLGPTAMLITGMLIGNMRLKQILSYRRVWLVTLLRLVVYPGLVLVLLWVTGAKYLIPGASGVLLVTLLACITPSASTITQMVQISGKNADYAGVINVVTTLLCIVTMPCMVALYQLL